MPAAAPQARTDRFRRLAVAASVHNNGRPCPKADAPVHPKRVRKSEGLEADPQIKPAMR
jgi:hypothetical protein